ncbi:MAG: hypothetical protein AB7O78_01750 [Thermoleophilia bacterium]
MKRVLVLGAGGPAGVNFIRALRIAPEPYWISAWDENPHHLHWPDADETYLAPPAGLALADRLAGYCDVMCIDLVVAQPDPLVKFLARFAGRLSATTCLPSEAVIDRCQSKRSSQVAWCRAGLTSGSVQIESVELGLNLAASTFGYPYWLRAASGAGGRGSTLVEDRYQAEAWIAYWRARRCGWDFIAEEYLPGANLAFTSVWRAGELLGSYVRERLEYIYPGASPSGITGTSAVCRTVHHQAANEAAAAAVRAVDPMPNGVYCVDLKEDAGGVPRPTEINAGRFFTICDLPAHLGANLVDLYVRAALDLELPDVAPFDCVPAGFVWARHIDCPAVLVREDSVEQVHVEFQNGDINAAAARGRLAALGAGA